MLFKQKIGKYIPNSDKNTDNAWIEYTVMNYHFSDSSLFDNIEIIVSFSVNFYMIFIIFYNKNFHFI
jgi:hypothetical protein